MASLLLIFVCALVINSQARILTEKRDEISPSRATGVADYIRPGTPPPPAPAVIEMITTDPNMFWIVTNYAREEHEVATPIPKEGPPTHQVTGCGASAEELGRDKPTRSPPTPAEAPPKHQVTGDGAAALGNYGKDGGEVAPPAPHHAPPTHQVSGGRAAEMEESWAY